MATTNDSKDKEHLQVQVISLMGKHK